MTLIGGEKGGVPALYGRAPDRRSRIAPQEAIAYRDVKGGPQDRVDLQQAPGAGQGGRRAGRPGMSSELPAVVVKHRLHASAVAVQAGVPAQYVGWARDQEAATFERP